jgi:endonuclease YncB( thermonuclease family)
MLVNQTMMHFRFELALDGCPDSRTALLNGEQTAKAARLGICGSDGFVMPWQWRRTHH